MKRTVTLVLVLAVLLSLGQTNALAVDKAVKMDFTGEYQIRGWLVGNYDADIGASSKKDSAFWEQQFKLKIDTRVNDNVRGTVGLLITDDDVWESKTGRFVTLDLAYINLKVPNSPLSLKLGRMDLALGHNIVLGSDQTWDTLLAEGTQPGPGGVEYGLFTSKWNEGNKANSGDDVDLYGGYLNLTPQPDLKVGLFIVYGNHTGNKLAEQAPIINSGADNFGNNFNQAFWVGVTSDVKMEPVTIQFEFDYSQLSLDKETTGNPDDTDATGFAAYGDISGMLANLNIGGSILYASGDENGRSTKASDRDSFSPIFSNFSDMNEYDLITLYWVREDILTNIMAFQIYYKGKMLNDKVATKLSAQYYQLDQAEKLAPGVTRDKTLGTEIDARFTYNIYENLSLTGKAGYLIADDEYFGKDSDDIWLLAHELVFTF